MCLLNYTQFAQFVESGGKKTTTTTLRISTSIPSDKALEKDRAVGDNESDGEKQSVVSLAKQHGTKNSQTTNSSRSRHTTRHSHSIRYVCSVLFFFVCMYDNWLVAFLVACLHGMSLNTRAPNAHTHNNFITFDIIQYTHIRCVLHIG